MKILIAEDDLVSRRVLQTMLARWGYDIVICKNGEEAWEALQEDDAPRLAILDWMMPVMDGVEVCHEVRKMNREPYIYILLLTAKTRKEDIIQGLEAGADDYVTKPFDAEELKVRLRAGTRIIDLQTELLSTREALREQATHDSLTGLWNRHSIIETLQRELSRSRRDMNPFGVIMADLDHFKDVNDTFGHGAGDAVLREVAKRMLSSIRPYDAVGRYGGEEFLIISPGCDRDKGLTLAERLRKSIAEKVMNIPDGTLSITLSLGVTAFCDGGMSSAESLISDADAALYRAKENGRNRAELSDAPAVEHFRRTGRPAGPLKPGQTRDHLSGPGAPPAA